MSEVLLILLVVVLLFGATSIPKIARALGQAKGEFKKGVEESKKCESDKSEK